MNNRNKNNDENKKKNDNTLNPGLDKERAELFRNINLKMFEELARQKGVTLDQLLSAGMKAYMEKDDKKDDKKDEKK